MADLPQQDTIVQYYADGITTQYAVPFYTPIETDGTPDLDVFTQLSTATPVPASDINTWNVDYTYTSNLDPLTGGYITFLTGNIPASGYVVTIVRDVSASLDVEFSQAQNFSGITLDAALDKLLLIIQQNKSYILGRNLSYIINSYLPESTIAANVQIPVLASGQVWYGSANGVIAATLEQSSDTSTLRSELASEAPTTDGATLVGYYDSVNLNPTTVADQLTLLTDAVVAPFPSGSIIDFGGTSAPSGFLICDGSSYSTTVYSDLFSAIGYTWGGSGSSFNVPNLSRSVTIGSGGTASDTIGNVVGDTFSGETTTLTSIDQIPNHTHITDGSVIEGGSNAWVGTNPSFGVSDATGTISGYGEAAPFNIIQTSAVVLKIIKT
jgi:microcystin-dependent protein